MAGRREHETIEGHVNLTPMIDVVFQLIIFFMLVTELTNLALERVVLPIAQYAKENPGAEGELVINIKQSSDKDDELANTDGLIVIAGQAIEGKGPELVKNLKARLQLETEAYDKWIANDKHPLGRNSELEVLVRSDRQIRAEYFLALMWACNDVGIYKVHVAAQQFRLE